jgi:hypothetical protein
MRGIQDRLIGQPSESQGIKIITKGYMSLLYQHVKCVCIFCHNLPYEKCTETNNSRADGHS